MCEVFTKFCVIWLGIYSIMSYMCEVFTLSCVTCVKNLLNPVLNIRNIYSIMCYKANLFLLNPVLYVNVKYLLNPVLHSVVFTQSCYIVRYTQSCFMCEVFTLSCVNNLLNPVLYMKYLLNPVLHSEVY